MSVDLLLDTHVVIWIVGDDPRWQPMLDGRIDDAALTISISAATWIEIALKHSIGKLSVAAARSALVRNGFLELPITGAHAEQLEQLPAHHRDPFDRILAAQAISEEMQLVTADRAFHAYEGLRLFGR